MQFVWVPAALVIASPDYLPVVITVVLHPCRQGQTTSYVQTGSAWNLYIVVSPIEKQRVGVESIVGRWDDAARRRCDPAGDRA